MSANSPIWKGLASGSLTETAESGQLKLAERVTLMQQFRGRYADTVTYAVAHRRGSHWTLTLANGLTGYYYVEDATCDQEKGGKGTVTVNYTYLGIMPPDEFALPPFEINPPAEKNAFFATLTQYDLQKARAAFNAATAAGKTSISNAIEGTTNKILTRSLVNKWLKGEETFYLAGFTFQHTIFSAKAPAASKGGFIQAPFGAFSGYVSLSGMSWLRKADEPIWSNGIWKLTRTWVGAPAGHWDTDFYPTP